ncbi:phosphate ABC transporter, periplasmic phosphate-binding protein [Campylobacter blaseri]|uniref:Phosphate-binding protein n=1 Tax=Campylobacter blaseri TaxID=2042961 RepID=A0A2P8R3Q2_9BACT|nr:PstS family phosphate ABC transporter substrate-binding protein [Campylobacter blaseri]PSM53132.1 phosphate-binding protein [Campylobacter blaseri]PSM54598.1 phosphate-binding protein [Campylobacter blaseri]QKF86929.1 phosphate ABC transporter, periplasmic phosphate-binding protein [Campylobacter blaseri]
MKLSKIALSAMLVLGTCSIANARDQIRIVGSSTVYPFSSYVAEELGVTTKFKTPVVESTGSGGGFKLFCQGEDLNTPDISNASRPMKEKEFALCNENGVKEIIGAMIGYDGIAFAQSSDNEDLDLTKKQLFLAVAKEIPVNGKLVANPYTKWSQIDSSLPDREIIIYGPPTSSGTRDAFEELVMQAASKNDPVYKAAQKEGKFKGYKVIRNDGVYVPSGENDNLIVQKLEKNKVAFGIFGYSFLAENQDKIKASKIEGALPTPKTIGDGSYPISRSLYFYVKKSHMEKIPAIKAYMDLFMSDKMIGNEGVLKTIGLIPMSDELRQNVQKSVLSYTLLTSEMVKTKKVIK